MLFAGSGVGARAAKCQTSPVTNAVRPRLLLSIVTLVAMLTSGFGSALWFCPSMGRYMSDCCCPPPAKSASLAPAQRPTAEIERPACCERLQPGTPVPAAATRQTSVSPSADVALTEPLPFLVTAVDHSTCSVLEPLEVGERPPRGPPLFLAHCALLI